MTPNEKSAVIPTQKTVLDVGKERADLIRDQFTINQAAVLPFVLVANSPSKRATKVSRMGLLAEAVDGSRLYSLGELPLRIVSRLQVEPIAIPESNDRITVKMRVRRYLDIKSPFKNKLLTRRAMATIHQIHGRCNELEAELRERQNRSHLVAAIRARPSMEVVLSEFLDFEENPSEEDIAAWLSFGALGFHSTVDVQLWAVSNRHPEARIVAAVEILERKQDRLNSDLKAMRAGINIAEPQSNEDYLKGVTQSPWP